MAARVVVEWTKTSLRVALSEGSRGTFKLRALQVEPLAEGADVAQVLEGALKKLGVKSAKAVGMIPRDQVISRLIRFPTMQEAELAQMVELYGKAQLPYPREQVVVDYHLLDRREGFSTVAVVACRRDVIERQLAPLKTAGLEVECLTASSWGVLGWYGLAARAVRVPEPVLVINRDEERTDLVLIREGRVLLSRSVGQGSTGAASSMETFEPLAQEVERSLASVRKELPGTEVRSLLLTGAGGLEPWRDEAARRFNLPVVAVEASQPLGVRAASGEGPVSPVVVGGAACADVRTLLNLSPPELLQQARQRRQIHELTLVAVLLLLVLGMAGALAALQGLRQRRIASEMGAVIAQMEPVTREVKAKRRATQVVASVLSQRQELAAILAGVFRVTPETVALEAFIYERPRRQIALRGRAPSTDDVLTYLKTLERLEGVTSVQLKHSTRRSTPAGERTDFELVLLQ